ncbi:MAG: TIGR02186 family protein [Alphaproteobacteria bacterium]|nr:TIGR02186 family protein [Alphaproteobacteria bacterium]MBV9377607.1 TIGR02186 family protein [Alphaproteobacteria bacterium]
MSRTRAHTTPRAIRVTAPVSPSDKVGSLRLLLVFSLLCWGPPAHAEELVADLTSHLIAITTGFTGASVVLFGAIDGPGDVIVAVRGPEREMTMRRKSRVAGIWVNTQAVTFANVPSFYAVAASRPMADILSPAAAAFYRLGIPNMKLVAATPAPSVVVDAFRAALERTQLQAGLFVERMGKVDFLGERLFRTTITFPSNVPTGTYLVEVFLVRDKDVVSGQTTPLVVSKVGVDASVSDFATRQPGFYGAIAVLTAVVAGWLASLPFRGA